ncbi:small ribosomal subunit Rsm22 family protein [Thermoanaerobacterium sp. RBIITD]|uniref:small ribosomal subunit Rsm22 family protein n=1 Tax=Thermoanaerobacterium sp. RBIITD TaxID=1550240 RepID=UPI000BB7AF4D|nr:small ribosomal subunit Rsm22 family protein [Thermoanaerobacterium sp. RBIITD]SNX54844.1 Ribosomal protein RSM22 (predicted rRNA methylase) [Thermoanaerobacterium sp. RBIITD]
MELPKELQKAIENEAMTLTTKKLAVLVSDISSRYREGKSSTDNKFLHSRDEIIAYIVYRMPATFGTVYSALFQVKEIYKEFKPKSLLDVGAGPGTAMWAATAIWPDIEKITLFEKDEEMIKIGKVLASNSNLASIKEANWLKVDVIKPFEIPTYDIIIASYSIGELPEDSQQKLIKKLWESTGDILIIIEPGTPIGFLRIKKARELLSSLGAHTIAPCPHDDICPMKDDDWCHFSSRITRSSMHRRVKNGELSYEDEKFSYLCMSHKYIQGIQGRIIRHPQIRKGHVSLEICSKDGLKQVVVTKKDREQYKKARDYKWGSIYS